jgi:hypothetical protein
VYSEKIKTVCSEIDRLKKQQVMAQRAAHDLKLSVKPSYANKASPSRSPEYLNNSSVSVTEHEKNSNQWGSPNMYKMFNLGVTGKLWCIIDDFQSKSETAVVNQCKSK